MIELFNMDCMEYMKGCDDNAFDLAIVDPPYGIGRDGGETGKNWKYYEPKEWDASPPNKEYFDELRRVSKNQIIWGANYFTQHLPASMGWCFWDKGQDLTMSDGELAYTSFQRALRRKVMNRCEIYKKSELIHPTQKPVKLYDWLLKNYAEPGQRILDTHLGSGSSAIAAHYFGVDFIGLEIDEDYYNAAKQRFDQETRQKSMFDYSEFAYEC
jgi:site-specific DNA-methyltransferase (adenine-specific)